MAHPEWLLAFVGLAAGGFLKGAIGAGAPVIGVPVLALLYNVPFAVAIFVLPNLFSNLWQSWTYRAHQVSRRFVWTFAIAGAVGAGVGSVLLAVLPPELLMASVAVMVLVYISVRLAKPHWVLARELAGRLAGMAGFLGGMLQGAAGISAPVSVTFLNAMRLERSEFIATISVFFAAMSLVQIPALWSLGILTPERVGFSLFAMVPLFGAMPLGAWAARRIDRTTFDRIILVVLGVIALRLLYSSLTHGL